MACTLKGEELSAYMDGELDRARALRVEQHLGECPECRKQLTALRSVGGMFALATPLEPDLRVRAGLARRLAVAEESPRFTCARAQISLSARADGELTGEEGILLQKHLDACPACASEWLAVQVVTNAMRALPEVAPPLGLDRSVRIAIARQQRSWLPLGLFDGLLRPRLAPGLASAAAAGILAVGFWMGRFFPGTVPPTPVVGSVYQGKSTPPKVEDSVRAPVTAVAQTPRPVSRRRLRAEPSGIAAASAAAARTESAPQPASATIRRKGSPARQPEVRPATAEVAAVQPPSIRPLPTEPTPPEPATPVAVAPEPAPEPAVPV